MPDLTFAHFMSHLRSTWKVGMAGSILPFGAAFAGISPPWPTGGAAITSVVMLAGLMALYVLRRTLSPRWISLSGCGGLALGLAIYLPLINIFTTVIPTTRERTAVGCGYTPQAVVVAKLEPTTWAAGQCPGQYEHMLEGVDFDNYQIWNKPSIAAIEVTLFATWLLIFTSMSALAGAIVLQGATGREPRRRKT